MTVLIQPLPFDVRFAPFEDIERALLSGSTALNRLPSSDLACCRDFERHHLLFDFFFDARRLLRFAVLRTLSITAAAPAISKPMVGTTSQHVKAVILVVLRPG